MTAYIPSLTLPSQIFSTPAASILLPIALGTSVGFAVSPKSTQKTYLALKQPPLNPPPYVFGPMWTVLYGLMGFAAHRAWTTGNKAVNPDTRALTRQGATLYTLQLALNLVWMPLFFRLKRPIEATATISVLTGLTAWLTYTWAQVDVVAGWALAPYLGWLGFATYLSAGVGYLNDWNFADKEVNRGSEGGDTYYPKGGDSVYVNEKKD